MDNGYDAEIVDCSYYGSGFEEVITKFKEDEKPIIGITSYTRDRFYAYDLIRKIRLEIPDSHIVVLKDCSRKPLYQVAYRGYCLQDLL